MKHFLVLSILAACLDTQAFALCPLGGSEHSVGNPGSGGPGLALARFEESVEIAGTRDLVRRHGYCPTSYGPQTKLVEQTCNANGCTSTYVVEMFYANPTTGDARTVSAHVRFTPTLGGPLARGYFSADSFSIEGLGTEEALDEAASELVMDAMEAAGVVPDQILMGANNLVAGRLQCRRVVVPGAQAHCKWTVGYDLIAVEDLDVAADLHQALADVGAYQLPVMMGSSRTNAALVRCTRVVYPGAKASCTIVIEGA